MSLKPPVAPTSAAGSNSVTRRLDAVEAGTSGAVVSITDAAYGAVAGSASDQGPAIQAAITAVAALGGGMVLIPEGDYVVNTTLTIPVGKRIELVGQGIGATGNFYVSRLKRTSGTNTMISAVGTALAAASRVYLGIRDIELSGGTLGGKILRVSRASALTMNRVRVARSTVTGAHFTGVFDSHIQGCAFETMGNGTTDPAVLFDSIVGEDTPAFGGSATVQISDSFFAGNTGTDLKLTGSLADSSPTNEVNLANCKLEGGSGSQPYIDLDYAQNCHFANVKISQSSGRTGTMIKQDGNSTGTRSNKFANLTLDLASGSATYLVEHGVGSMQFTGVNCTGSAPGTAHFRVKSTVSAGRFVIKGLYVGTSATRVLDERTVDERIGKGVARLVRQSGAATNALVGGTQTWLFADAASNDAYGNIHISNDCLFGSALTFEILWTCTASSGNCRWQVGSQNPFSSTEDVSAAATAYVGDFASPTVNLLKRDTLAGPTAGNPGETLQCTITRLGSHANDTLTAGANLVALNVLYDAVI